MGFDFRHVGGAAIGAVDGFGILDGDGPGPGVGLGVDIAGVLVPPAVGELCAGDHALVLGGGEVAGFDLRGGGGGEGGSEEEGGGGEC